MLWTYINTQAIIAADEAIIQTNLVDCCLLYIIVFFPAVYPHFFQVVIICWYDYWNIDAYENDMYPATACTEKTIFPIPFTLNGI